ncbi:MAG: arginase [Deltaproteobacteria bacterium]|nr:arginase [Deltaproteobacteria bacterium]
MTKQQKAVSIIGAPMDLGTHVRGAALGPDAIRLAGLHAALKNLGYDVVDCGNVEVPDRESADPGQSDQRFLPAIVGVCQHIRDLCYQALEQKRMPLLLGGDHSVAIGSLSAVSSWMQKNRSMRPGCIWVDAHADMNTPATSPSGNIHGMPLSVALGSGPAPLLELGGKYRPLLLPGNTAIIGLRSVDREEARLCKESGIRYYGMRDIDERGIAAVAREALAWAGQDTSGIHLSFDLDALDPTEASAVSSPEHGGLSFREVRFLLEVFAESGMLCSMDFTELNPLMDQGSKGAGTMVKLIEAALGNQLI